MRATLIVNPGAGRARLFDARMVALLGEHGYSAEVVESAAAVDGTAELAARAASHSSLVIACGGDGTVHGVVQGLAFTEAALGVIPLGTANALARNLGLPMEPVAAMRRLLTYEARTIPLGEMETARTRRYFVSMAGCGPDGALVRATAAGWMKARLGRTAYYAGALRLFALRRWPEFEVEYRVEEVWVKTRGVALLVSRVADLGGVFGRLTPLASLTARKLHVQVLRAPAMVSMPAWIGLGRVGLRTPWVTAVDADEVRCTALSDEVVHAQADAEPMGELPMRLRVAPGALRMLMPAG